MRQAEVEEVRRFNRTVTQRAGALDDRFLARSRPMGEARVLWEIGTEGCEVRSLRARLGLDSGHASRLLRALEADDLVRVEASRSDRRVRVARLTPAGLSERSLLDERSNDLAASILAPLDRGQRDELVGAMRTVRRLVMAAAIEIRPADPAGPDARRCLRAYFAELDRRSESGFDPDAGISADPEELVPPRGCFLVAYLRDEPVGCGAVKHHRERAVGAQAHVGGRVSARPGHGAPPAHRARGDRAGQRRARDPVGDQPLAGRGDRACTARPATSRCPRSTTSRLPTTGSRSGSAAAHASDSDPKLRTPAIAHQPNPGYGGFGLAFALGRGLTEGWAVSEVKPAARRRSVQLMLLVWPSRQRGTRGSSIPPAERSARAGCPFLRHARTAGFRHPGAPARSAPGSRRAARPRGTAWQRWRPGR